MTDSRIIDGKLELPTKTVPRPASLYLQGVYVVHAEGDNLPRFARVSSDGLTFTLSDDWLTLGDIQAIADAIDTKFGRPIQAVTVRHAIRRAIIVLMEERGRSQLFTREPGGVLVMRDALSREIEIRVDFDLPPRTIRVELEAK